MYSSVPEEDAGQEHLYLDAEQERVQEDDAGHACLVKDAGQEHL